VVRIFKNHFFGALLFPFKGTTGKAGFQRGASLRVAVRLCRTEGGFQMSKAKKLHLDAQDVRSRNMIDDGESIALVVENGRVVDSSRRVAYTEGQEAHIVGIPWMSPQLWSRRLPGTLVIEVDDRAIEVGLTIIAEFASVQFVSQELYDQVVAKGHCHIDDAIVAAFLEAAKADKYVKDAFRLYASALGWTVFDLLGALTEAFRGMKIILPFSNLKEIRARAEVDVVAATVWATYTHYL
jgi:hypothetical protein